MRLNKSIGKNAGIFLLVALLSIGMVSAFGVGASYWKGNPYSLAPGESGEVVLYLQNLIGNESVSVVVQLKQGSEIAAIGSDEELTIPANTQNIDYPILISIPETYEVGSVHTVVVSFIEVGEPGSGTISVGKGYDISFDVAVTAEPTQTDVTDDGEGNNAFVWITLAIIVILVIVVVLIVRRKN